MAVTSYAVVAKNFYSSNFISQSYTLPPVKAGDQVRGFVTLEDVDVDSSINPWVYVEQSKDAGVTWTIIAMAQVIAPSPGQKKNGVQMEFAIQDSTGQFRVRSLLTGTVSVSARVDIITP